MYVLDVVFIAIVGLLVVIYEWGLIIFLLGGCARAGLVRMHARTYPAYVGVILREIYHLYHPKQVKNYIKTKLMRIFNINKAFRRFFPW